MLLLPLLAVASLAAAKTLDYDFHIGWTRANPDGAFERAVIGVNGEWPIPAIVGSVGDEVVIKVTNDLRNQSTALHFHGLYMNGTVHMDGPTQVTQCAIPPGGEFTYKFTLQQPGTYWYHSHHKGQYPDGLRGPLIIHDPENPFKGAYDEELTLTVSDWYHEPVKVLNTQFLTKFNPSGAEPVPQAALLNDTQNLHVPIVPGKTYLVRLINMGALAAQYIWFEGHDVQIVEVDGQYTKPTPASMLYLSVAQRYSVLLTAKSTAAANFPIIASMDTELFDVLPKDLNYNVTGWLVYDESATLPSPQTVDEFAFFDDINLTPLDEKPLLTNVARRITLDVMMDNLRDGANYAFFNNITYQPPRVPSLYTALSAGDLATDARIYGEFTNPFVLDKGEVVEIVLNNLDTGKHPFHLHGHDFQIVHRSAEEAGPFADEGVAEEDLDPIPVRRDTVVVWPEGNVVLRFVADNPGVWFFHCHIEWHVTSGLIATFVEAPLDLQKTISIPANHLAVCEQRGVKTQGNAAGNTHDFLDLNGQRRPPPPLPEGFTPKGWIALGFTSLMGVLGLTVVAWYGLSETLDKRALDNGAANERGYATIATSDEIPTTPGGSRISESTPILFED
ncbi:hypothetical protein TD95_004084 [Thielaviopsis punctulata]|uniref:Laccase n=1 Tax=Thielaviopsis punctulata TaxID=72032 RepID=A0A0F4ZKZ9_9PEZI|nr:hypothetical protein TD95_004084 [Thielaviopsis punctulata]